MMTNKKIILEYIDKLLDEAEQEVTKEPEYHELKIDNVYQFRHINLEGISGEQ